MLTLLQLMGGLWWEGRREFNSSTPSWLHSSKYTSHFIFNFKRGMPIPRKPNFDQQEEEVIVRLNPSCLSTQPQICTVAAHSQFTFYRQLESHCIYILTHIANSNQSHLVAPKSYF